MKCTYPKFIWEVSFIESNNNKNEKTVSNQFLESIGLNYILPAL